MKNTIQMDTNTLRRLAGGLKDWGIQMQRYNISSVIKFYALSNYGKGDFLRSKQDISLVYIEVAGPTP